MRVVNRKMEQQPHHLDGAIREVMDVLTDPRYSTVRLVAGMAAMAVVNALADYCFIQLVRSGASTSILFVYRAIERHLL